MKFLVLASIALSLYIVRIRADCNQDSCQLEPASAICVKTTGPYNDKYCYKELYNECVKDIMERCEDAKFEQTIPGLCSAAEIKIHQLCYIREWHECSGTESVVCSHNGKCYKDVNSCSLDNWINSYPNSPYKLIGDGRCATLGIEQTQMCPKLY